MPDALRSQRTTSCAGSLDRLELPQNYLMNERSTEKLIGFSQEPCLVESFEVLLLRARGIDSDTWNAAPI
jgi:hypothetical protein